MRRDENKGDSVTRGAEEPYLTEFHGASIVVGVAVKVSP